MLVDILIEPLESQGFRASCDYPWRETVEAATREEALNAIKASLRTHWRSGTHIVRMNLAQVNIDAPIWPDDEFTKLWLEGIEEARQRADLEELHRDSA